MKPGLVMSMKAKLLAIVGSHRKKGNYYALAKSILKSTSSKSSARAFSAKNVCTETVS